MADALSRKKTIEFAAPLMIEEWNMVEFVQDFEQKLTVEESFMSVAHICIQPLIDDPIIVAQREDEWLVKMRKQISDDE
ncbi:hypothetical protein PJP13_29565, partial [Mycobacterium kansasii]